MWGGDCRSGRARETARAPQYFAPGLYHAFTLPAHDRTLTADSGESKMRSMSFAAVAAFSLVATNSDATIFSVGQSVIDLTRTLAGHHEG
jgi:hypothetical protein